MNNPTPRPGPSVGEITGEALLERVRSRTRELVSVDGREAWEVSQSDYEQAKREVIGQAAPDAVRTDGLAP